jgi:cell wall-associated NlpC family hydrolase
MSPAPDHTVLLSMVETLIVESKMKNLSPSQSDPGSRSRGLFQQQVGPGFSWHGGTNRELATQEYVAAAITIHAKYPTLDAGQIAAQVQRPSANYNGEDLRLRYGHHAAEAERWLDAWQGQPAMPPKDGSGSPDTKKTKQTRKTSTSQGYEFSRSATQTNWDAIKQLADDVRWRAYSDGVVIMFIDDLTLLKLPVKASFREGASGGLKGWTTADWIDFDHDVGKRVQTATVTVAPSLIPFGVAVGSVVMLDSVGLGSGIYLVSDIQLDFWSSTATLQVVRPQQPLPEPPDPSKPSSKTKQQKQDTKDASYDHGSAGERAVAWAAQFLGKPYHYGGGHSFKAGWGAAKTYGDQQLKAYTTGFDCSSFVRCAWAQEGVDVGTYTDNQVSQARLQGIPSGSGRLPKGGWIAGDLVFPYYDANGSTKYDHVVMMTGKGNQAIEAPYTGANIRYRDMGPAAPPFWCRWFGASK